MITWRLIMAALLLACWPSLAAGQAVIVPSPVPALTANCVLQYNSSTGLLDCNAISAVSQPLTDGLGLIADNVTPSKILAFQLSGLTASTTRTWTIPDANLTFPTTGPAGLGGNTFTGSQVMNGGLASTTGTFSSTLGVTGNLTLSGTGNAVGTITSGVWNAGALTSSGLLAVNGFGTHSFSAGSTGGNVLLVRNTTSGASNYAELDLGTDRDPQAGILRAMSSTYTTAGAFVADGVVLYSQFAGGQSIQSAHASGAIRFYSGGTSKRWEITSAGNLLPGAGNTYSIGDGTTDPALVYTFALVVRNSTYPIQIPNWAHAATGTDVVWNANGYLYQKTSSARFKEHIDSWVVSADALSRFVALSPRLWDYKGQQDGAGGFIAEDLAALDIPNPYGRSVLTNYDAQGRPESNRDYALIGLQHLVLQDHDSRLAAIEAKLKDVK